MKIGGMFKLESNLIGRGYPRPENWSDMVYCMSGRCAIYACLQDILINNPSISRIAYVPSYTCETVLSSYLKAGFSLRFYDVDRNNLSPMFKEEDLKDVGVLNLCGYFGFSTYDPLFVKLCQDKKIVILQDTTHTPFSVCPSADYAAGSLRKWIGIISGGVAMKKASSFTLKLKDPDQLHINGRRKVFSLREEGAKDEAVTAAFWENELALRKNFDFFSGDDISKEIIEHFDFSNIIALRRKNFTSLINALKPNKAFQPVFRSLDEDSCPSHFCLYAEDRESLQKYLSSAQIKSTVYWPNPPMITKPIDYPQSDWIYSHILSIPIDQRFGDEHMAYLAQTLNSYSGSF